MPGIVGLITRMPQEDALAELMSMLQSLRHASFYTTGVWFDEPSGVYVGWTQDETCSVELPLRNERGNLALVFAGQEFPDPGTVSRLKSVGHSIDCGSFSHLVHIAEEDAEFPATLNGRFQGLLTNRTDRTSLLFNDRYGMQRVYYHEAKDAFYFSCEAKAILAVKDQLRTPDKVSLGELVSCGSVLENRTLFHGIEILPAGSAWRFRNGCLESKSRYFDPSEWENQDALDIEPYYKKLREVFSTNLSRYFHGGRNIAMSLTGGLDTRMIMAWYRSQAGSLPCYTFGGMLRDCHDVRVARKVANACGQSHQIIPVSNTFLAKFSHYAEKSIYYTDGCVDVSRSPDLYLNEQAREIAPVRMTGNYGGEVLRRVRAFKPVDLPSGLLQPDLVQYVNRARATFYELTKGHPVSFAMFKQGPWHHYGVLSLEQTQVSMRSPYLDNDFVRTVYRAPKSTLTSNDISLRLIADGNRNLLHIRTDRGVAGSGGRARTFAWHAFLEAQFKADYVYDMGMPQWVARVDHSFSALHLERFFLGRHKIFHFRIWYRDALARYIREMLLDPRTLSRPYVERKGLESIVQGHLQGNRNYTTELHKMLTLELIHRLFFDDREKGGGSNDMHTAIAPLLKGSSEAQP